MQDTQLHTPQRINIGIFGFGDVGKTSILHRYLNEEFVDEEPTSLESEMVTKVIDGVPYCIIFHDTSGKDENRKLQETILHELDGIMFVYNMSDPMTFYQLESVWKTVTAKTRISGYNYVLCANHFDAVETSPKIKHINRYDGAKFADLHNCTYFEVSAKTGKNVTEAFDHLIGHCVNERKHLPFVDITEVDEFSEEY